MLLIRGARLVHAMVSETNHPLKQAICSEPDVEQRRALIERVAASVQLRRSTRLRDFLLYVGGQSLKEGCPEIHEQEIGARVFGRPASYDRSQDNIVRVNATELRKRIELYFAGEGADEPLIFSIPRGGYKPIFGWRTAPVEEAAAPVTVAHPDLSTDVVAIHSVAGQDSPSPQPWVWIAVSVVLTILCGWLLVQNHRMSRLSHPWEGLPELSAFWADFTRPSAETDLVLPDASVSLSEEMLGRPISFSDYLDRNYLRDAQSSTLSSDRKADVRTVFLHNLVMLGDFHAAQQILLLPPLPSRMHLQLSRFFTADSIKRDNLILIGGRKANPWVRIFDDQLNFSLDYDNQRAQMFIANRHPQPGEPPVYMAAMDRNSLTGYSVISYLPNQSRTGNVLILAGTDADATAAAAEFLTSESQMKKFRADLRVERLPYFELLLKTSRLSGTSFNAEIVAYRLHP